MNSKLRRAPPAPELIINLCAPSAELRARLQLLATTKAAFSIIASSEPSRERSISLYLLPIHALNLVEQIRGFSAKPIIAHGPPEGVAPAFRCGCCDYLKEPWDEQELLLRSKRFMGPTCLNYPWGELLLEGGLCTGPTGAVLLSPTEERIFKALIQHRGEAVSRRLLLTLLDHELPSTSRTADMHISILRKKMHRILPSQVATVILTARPSGYMLR